MERKLIMQEINGMVKDLQVKGLDEATVVTVEYEVNSKIYTIKESLKYETKSFKLGFLPIGQKNTKSKM